MEEHVIALAIFSWLPVPCFGIAHGASPEAEVVVLGALFCMVVFITSLGYVFYFGGKSGGFL